MGKVRVLLVMFVLAPSLLAQSAQPAPPIAAGNEARLTPRTSFDGPYLEFDFPSLQIGVAEYDEGPTGATVFYFPK